MSHTHTADTRARISRGLKRFYARKRAVSLVTPRDLRLTDKGLVAPSLRPALLAAEAECADVLEALGGADHVSPQRRVIVEDLARVGVALRGTLAAYVRTSDPELASKIGSLASVRRALLTALGLERREREIDLKAYVAQRAAENCPGATNGNEPDTSPASARVDAVSGREGGARAGIPPSPAECRPHPSSGEPAAGSPTANDNEHDESPTGVNASAPAVDGGGAHPGDFPSVRPGGRRPHSSSTRDHGDQPNEV